MKSASGFSLVELLVAMTVMLLISGAAFTAILKLGTTQSTIWNRTQMHSGIRGATEVLQQEVGQAGRLTLVSTGSLTCTNDAAVPCLSTAAASSTNLLFVSSICGMYIGENLVLDVGANQETITIFEINGGLTDPTPTQCPLGSSGSTPAPVPGNIATTAPIGWGHAVGTQLQALGGFVAGIVPTTTTNGSTASTLKLFGDINGDGNMVYIEYSVQPSCICSNSCNPSTMTGNLYRNSMAWNVAAPKTQASASQILLGNVTANPNGNACFSYQQQTVNGDTYVTDVAVTLTVQTQLLDPITHSYQTETKALLNVSPRNVFNTWELASGGYTDRKQATPSSITALMAGPP